MGRKLAICTLAAILTPCAFGKDKPPALGLSVTLKDRYNSDFRVCTLVAVNVPLQIEWTYGPFKSRISGLVGEPTGDVYPLSFSVEEGTAQGPQYSETIGLKLTLEKPIESEHVASGAFNDVHEESVLLTQKGCQ
jgi:hypothetical protein